MNTEKTQSQEDKHESKCINAALSADETNHPAEGRWDGTRFKTWIQLHALSRKHTGYKDTDRFSLIKSFLKHRAP